MQPSSANLTFFLPVMVLVVIEISRIAREVNLRKVAIQDHRPLIISGIFLLPLNILNSLVSISSSIVLYQINMIYDTINRQFKLTDYLITIQIRFLEFIANEEPPEEVESWFKRTNKTVAEYYQERLNRVRATMESYIRNKEKEVLGFLSRYESVLAPPLGRFSLLHAANFAILSYLFILASTNLDGVVREISISLVGIIWVFQPILEVDEYDTLLKDDKPVNSLINHIFSTIILLSLITMNTNSSFVFDQIKISALGTNISLPISAELIIFMLGVVTIWWFLRTLYKEMKNVASNVRIPIAT
jgi:hypothetical protein